MAAIFRLAGLCEFEEVQGFVTVDTRLHGRKAGLETACAVKQNHPVLLPATGPDCPTSAARTVADADIADNQAKENV